MERSEICRRLIHMSAPVFLVYYLLPYNLSLDPSIGFFKWQGVLVIVAAALIVEALRLRSHKVFFGLRDYEQKQVSAFAWFSVGMGLALLVFPMKFVVPVVFGMAFIDPLSGEVRKRKKNLYPTLPLILYGIIILSILTALFNTSILVAVILSAVASPIAILSEWRKIKYVDDDFMMIVLPLLALTGFDYLLTLI